ncbi:hypothetical protein GYMLUDRAFT_94389 [Collybiopsis luxurians FD-317 M1]|nr:hypothetical protein GYMLUDRAFT_94389 [Collybiopsis luxurians FD-317 M1]
MAIEKLASQFTGTLKSLERDMDRQLVLPQFPIQFFDNKIDDAATKNPGSLYILNQQNNTSWDAFCYIGTTGYGFQFTVSKDHKIKRDGLLALQRRCSAADMRSVIFIIITPKDISFRLPGDLDPPKQRPSFSFYQLQLDFGARHNEAFLKSFYSDSLGSASDGMAM